jgi:hypothetical protein
LDYRAQTGGCKELRSSSILWVKEVGISETILEIKDLRLGIAGIIREINDLRQIVENG